MATLRYIGPASGYLPSVAGQVVAFIKQPTQYKLNEYCQYVAHDEPTGLYTTLGRDEPVRVVTSDEFSWEDTSDMPTGELYKTRFQETEFRCRRFAFPWRVGNVAANTAKFFKPKITQMAEALSMCMTHRTRRYFDLLEDTTVWGANTSAANTLNSGAGPWDKASDYPDSPNFMAFAKSILQAARTINFYTNGVVGIEDLRLILNPTDAIRIGMSPEMRHYLANSPAAKEEMANPGGRVNQLWSLPKTYVGMEIIVEDAVIVKERPNPNASATSLQATANRQYIKPSGTALIVSRKGGIDGTYGEKSYSTVQMYYYKDLLRIKQEYDSWNEYIKGAVVDYFVMTLVAPPAGYYITSLFSN